MQRIEISKTSKGFIAWHYQLDTATGEITADQSIIDLFGQHFLPTPFTAQANETDVLKTIRSLNPLATVILRKESN